MVCRIRVSMTFTAGPRCEMGIYGVPYDVSLPDLGIGVTNDDFHIAGT